MLRHSDTPAATPAPTAPRATTCARRVAASLAAADSGRLATALEGLGEDDSAFEASVRYHPQCGLSANRMMVERASFAVVAAIADAIDCPLPSAARVWHDSAVAAGVPIISGWDLRDGGGGRCLKLYVNASDASRERRRHLRDTLLPDLAAGGPMPAVIGMNARADGMVERKLYVQSADAVDLAAGAGAAARELAAASRAQGADAGGVLSHDVVGGDLHPRAFFVALREPPDGEPWQCVRSLPGYDVAAIETLLPFAPAAPRSLGVAAGDAGWTLYFKPRGSGAAPQELEPAAVFRCAAAEVGVFVEPSDRAPRAFRRTERYAVSVRIRDGEPAPRELESLVDWFTAQLRESERNPAHDAPALAAPPAPWHLVAGQTRPAAAAGSS